jgi:uncharacterized protein DUF6602
LTNEHIKGRLEGIKHMLMGAHQAGNSLSSASKGNEREAFINGVLSQVLPPHFRFGSGDITDQVGARSGQLDIVVEYPFVPSLPIVAGRSPRLYLAEGVVAVIEIKSNLSTQWTEVEATAKQLSVLDRNYLSGISFGPMAGQKIPLYAVGYTGWKQFETVKSHLNPQGGVNGVLVIEHGHFAGRYEFLDDKKQSQWFEYDAQGSSMALWGLITCIHHAGSMVTSTTKNVPKAYGQ